MHEDKYSIIQDFERGRVSAARWTQRSPINELERRSFTDPVPVEKPDKEEPSVEPSIDTHLLQVKVKSKEDVEERLMLPSFEKQREVFSLTVEGRFVQLDNEQSFY